MIAVKQTTPPLDMAVKCDWFLKQEPTKSCCIMAAAATGACLNSCCTKDVA